MFVRNNKNAIPLLSLGLLFCFICTDLWTTYLATPDLKLEANPIIRYFAWGWHEIIIYSCFLFIITIVLSILSNKYILKYLEAKSVQSTFISKIIFFFSCFFVVIFFTYLIGECLVSISNYFVYLSLYCKTENLFYSVAVFYVNFHKENNITPHLQLIIQTLLYLFIGISIAIYRINCTRKRVLTNKTQNHGRLKKKYKIAIIAIISAVVILSFPPLYFFVLNSSQISYGTLQFDKNREKLYLNDSILWDTGANGSAINEGYEDKIPNKTRIGFSLAFDTFHKMKLRKLYYSSQCNTIMDLNINNFLYTIRNQPEEMAQNNEIGSIGMDVICTANWLIDFTSEKVEVSSHDETYETKDTLQLKLKYKQKKFPKTQLNFPMGQFKNVLIDAGYNGEITLLKSDIEKINTNHKHIATLMANSYGVHSTTPTITNGYVYDSLKINDIYFNNVHIIEGNQRIIGYQFFKRFDKVYLDTKEKEFRFY